MLECLWYHIIGNEYIHVSQKQDCQCARQSERKDPRFLLKLHYLGSASANVFMSESVNGPVSSPHHSVGPEGKLSSPKCRETVGAAEKAEHVEVVDGTGRFDHEGESTESYGSSMRPPSQDHVWRNMAFTPSFENVDLETQ